MSHDDVRFGLIGFGAWGVHHARAIEKSPGARLVAIAARSDATCAAARTAHPSAAIYSSYREMLARDDLDVVTVVLPSHLHHEAGLAVLRSGRHLLLEKPMALTVEQCRDLCGESRSRNLRLAVGHELRHSSLFGRVHQLVKEGAVGTPLYVLVELSRRPYRHGADGWRYDIRRVGDWILEEPIHFFDLARWYLESHGEPQSVYATANSRQQGHEELHDNFSAVVHFPRGAYAVVTQTLAAFEHHQTVKITGTRGAIWASWSGPMDRTLRPTYFLKQFDGEAVRELVVAKTPGEVFELEDQAVMMVAAVRNGRTLAATAEDGLWSVAMCRAAGQSVQSGQRTAIQP